MKNAINKEMCLSFRYKPARACHFEVDGPPAALYMQFVAYSQSGWQLGLGLFGVAKQFFSVKLVSEVEPVLLVSVDLFVQREDDYDTGLTVVDRATFLPVTVIRAEHQARRVLLPARPTDSDLTQRVGTLQKDLRNAEDNMRSRVKKTRENAMRRLATVRPQIARAAQDLAAQCSMSIVLGAVAADNIDTLMP